MAVVVVFSFRHYYARTLLNAPLDRGLALGGVALGICVAFLWTFSDDSRQRPLQEIFGYAFEFKSDTYYWIWLGTRALGYVLLAPLIEELGFRALLFRFLDRQFPNLATETREWLAVAVSALAFGLCHERYFAGFLAGLGYALLYQRKRDLRVAFLSHSFTNFAILILSLVFQNSALIG